MRYKCLELRILVPYDADDKTLNEIGEQFQEQLPDEFEANSMDVEDITFEVKVIVKE
jgi:translation elongation factor EF-1beta